MKKAVLGFLSIGLLLSVCGPAFADIRTMSWAPVTTYTDNTPIETGVTTTYTVYWTSDPALSPASLRQIASALTQTSTTFDPAAQGMTPGATVYFTGKTVLSTGAESVFANACSWVVPAVPVAPAPPTLSGLSVSGPSSVNEGGTGTYTATASWSDGTATVVTPTWSVSSPYATIGASGVLSAGLVSTTQTVTVSASYSGGGATVTATRSVTVVDLPPTLSGLSVSGPSSVNEGGTGTYTATASWSDGTATVVTPTWSVSSAYATIGASGVLSAGLVSTTQTVTVSASYTSGGATVTATRSVTVVDVPGTGPASPANLLVAGTVQAGVWRLSWDPVTAYLGGSLLEPGRVVRYNAYWSRDSRLPDASLMPLASLTSESFVDFSPASLGMLDNERVYFAVRAILDTGETSPLSADITWRVKNQGPTSPSGARIRKK